MTQDLKLTKLDRMRYTKDKIPSNLVLLAIVMNVFYFVAYYQCDVANYYYTWHTGASVIYNLLFLLIAFLCSEGVKSRKTGYSIPLMVIGALQLVRIFYLPARAVKASVEIGGNTIAVLSQGKYTFMVICLAISGVLCITAGILSYLNNKKLAAYMRTIEN